MVAIQNLKGEIIQLLFLKNGACHYGLLMVHHIHVDIYDQNYLL
jgi:hypothetical protein